MQTGRRAPTWNQGSSTAKTKGTDDWTLQNMFSDLVENVGSADQSPFVHQKVKEAEMFSI